MPKKSKGKKKKEIAVLVADFQRTRESGKRCYRRSDGLLKKLAKLVSANKEFEIGGKGRQTRRAILHDRFADARGTGIIWTPCAARRFELEIL